VCRLSSDRGLIHKNNEKGAILAVRANKNEIMELDSYLGHTCIMLIEI